MNDRGLRMMHSAGKGRGFRVVDQGRRLSPFSACCLTFIYGETLYRGKCHDGTCP